MSNSAQNQGFTLIELLIVISLITILTGAMIPRFTGYLDNQNLRQAQEQVKSDLRSAVVRALAGVGAAEQNLNYWGIVFTVGSSKYSTVSCDDTSCTNIYGTQVSEDLPGNSVVRGVTGGTRILFSTSNGNTSDGATHTVYIGPDDSTTPCAGVEVNSVGMVKKVNVAVCP